MKIDFDGIQAFVYIAELGGFSKASEQLHVSQTALTRRLQKLETYLGVRLLERTTRYVQLTQVGRDFLPQAVSIVSEITSSVERIKNQSVIEYDCFALACVPTMAKHLLPKLIEEYSTAFSSCRIRITDGNSDEVRDTILNGAAELGICVQGANNLELIEQLLLNDEMVLACSAEHPLCKFSAVRWSEICNTKLVVLSDITATRRIMDHELSLHGIKLSNTHDIHRHSTAISLVSSGMCCAVLPSSAIQKGDFRGVRKIRLIEPLIQRTIVLVRRKNAILSPAAFGFLNIINAR